MNHESKTRSPDRPSALPARASPRASGCDAFSPLAELPAAIENGQLRLVYQPKIELSTARLAGVEALVRWQHPQRGLMHPAEFIPQLERAGACAPLTAWVVHAALRQVAQWSRESVPIKVSVNVSPGDLIDRRLPALLINAARELQVSLASVCIELTESVAVEDRARCASSMADLARIGVSLSLDDYGTRHSSLLYVKDLPVHELKIDRVFIHDMVGARKASAIVQSTIDLGRALGFGVVAEGIEHPEQWAALERMGCSHGQGFLFSPPLAAPDLAEWLRRWPQRCRVMRATARPDDERPGRAVPYLPASLAEADTAPLAAWLDRHLSDVESARRDPDLRLLRAMAAELQSRRDRGPLENRALSDTQQWLEWDGPRFEPSPGASRSGLASKSPLG